MAKKKNEAWYMDGKNLLILALIIVAAAQAVIISIDRKAALDLGLNQESNATQPATAGQQAQPPATANEAQQEATSSAPVQNARLEEESAVPEETAEIDDANRVSVQTIRIEPEFRRYLLLSFDRPVGQDKVGKAPDKNPGSFSPEMDGSWNWISPFVLRFDAHTPFTPNANYYFYLDSENFDTGSYTFGGDTGFTLRSEPFIVTNLTLQEEPDSSVSQKVVVTGQVEFSYPVSPKDFAKFFTLTEKCNGREQPVAMDILTTYRSETISFRSGPVNKDKDSRTIVATVAAGLQTPKSGLQLDEPALGEISLVYDPNLKVRDISVVSGSRNPTLKVSFSTPVRPDAAPGYVEVSPKVPFTVTASGSDLLLSGEFKPGQDYTLSVKEGLIAADGAVLPRPFKDRLHTPDLESRVAFEKPGVFLTRGGYQSIALTSVNTPKAELYVDRIYANNLFMLLQDYNESTLLSQREYKGDIRQYLGDRIIKKKLNLAAPRNQIRQVRLDLGKIIPQDEHGFYRVMVAKKGDWEAAQRWVLLTDIGLVAKKGRDDLLVWANSFKNLKALENVHIRVLSTQNQLVAEGQTDSQGLWSAKGLFKKFEKDQPYLILAETGDDFSFLLYDGFRIDTTGQDVGGKPMPKSGYNAYLYGERDIYRPGETVQGVAVVRDMALHAPQPMPFTLRLQDPRGKKYQELTLKSDADGLAEFSFAMPEYALTGGYKAELLLAGEIIGTYEFKVEEFLPDRIKVEIAADTQDAAPGQELGFTVSSNYLFGPPSAGMNVEATVRLEAAPFAPAGYEGYAFGDPDRKFDDQEIFTSGSEQMLDDNGRRSFSTQIPKGLQPPAALLAVVSARVRERGGRGVNARQRIPSHAYQRYPGLKKLSDRGVEPGQKFELDYVVLSPQGKPTPSGRLQADFYKDRWQTVLRLTPSGGYRYESIRDSYLLSSQELPSGREKGSFSIVPPRYGGYRVVLRDPDSGAASQVSFYAYGGGYSPWALENPATIELVPDKDEYQDGEEAVFQVRAPFSGKLLVTVEGQDVLDTQVVRMEGNTATVRLPVHKEYAPNVYCSAVLIRTAEGMETGESARASGWCPFNVARQTNHPAVRISAPQEVRPETRLELAVQTEPGAVVTIAAVDEGILQLIAQETPDPFSYFYAKRALGVDSYDIFSLLLPELPPVHEKSPAGGGKYDKLGQFVRTEGIRRVKPVAYWSGPLKTDASGRATYAVELPEFNGALRIMAVCLSGGKFGSAHAMTRIKAPLIITPTFPRSLAMGDKALIPVTLRNESKADGDFLLDLDVTGPATAPESQKSLAVAKGREETVYFPLDVGDTQGKLDCLLRASGNDETAKATVELGVRSAYPPQNYVRSGSLESSSLNLSEEDAAGLRPETVVRSLRIGRLPLVRFSGGLKDLLEYPYGCVEQTVSRAFPLLYFGDLAKVLAPDVFETLEPSAMVQNAITRVLAMQTSSGGFGMWPGATSPQYWASVYATHFLHEAGKAGYQVPKSALNSALRFLSSMIRGQKGYTYDSLDRTAYALYVLALAGHADQGMMGYLLKNHLQSMRKEAAYLLAGAYAIKGETSLADKIIHRNYRSYKGGRQSGDNFSSPIRNLALQLLLRLDVAPDDRGNPELVKELVRLLDADPHRSTQENAFSFLALGKYFRSQQNKAPYTGKIYAGETLLADCSSEKVLTLDKITAAGPIRIVMDTGYAPGAAYYSLTTRGIPTAAEYTPRTQGLEIKRTYLDRSGKELQLDALKQGDLIVLETKVRSLKNKVKNVVVQNLLPSGLEVENPRLESTERLPWIGKVGAKPAYQDLRDDRVLLFVTLPGKDKKHPEHGPWQTYYSLLRAVTPGSFTLPPSQVEAMYAPELTASTPAGELKVNVQ